MQRQTVKLLCCALLLSPMAALAEGFTEVTLEGGILGFSYNDAQIPNSSSADRFDVTEITGAGPVAYGRLNIQRRLGDRHLLRGLYAPVRIEGIGTFDEDVRFDGETFAADTSISGLYQFNTYRLTYRYEWLQRSDWTVGVGATVLVRDANIRLVQGETRAESTDLGAVPLLHSNIQYRFNDRWGAEFDIDALANPMGRAVDAILMGTYQRQEDVTWRLGYRTLEGGGDGSSVYTFAWLHYAMLGISYQF